MIPRSIRSFVVDSPQLLNCRVVTSWQDQMQVKLSAATHCRAVSPPAPS